MSELYLGDCLDVLKTLPDNSVDSVVTDPPYGLRFMNRHWDYDVPTQAVWQEVLRVLKPGGHVLSFAGSRTYHRMVVAIEDAGFEVRDQLMWVYGSGFPKSLDVSKALDRMAGAEREAILIPTKPGNRPEQAGPIALGASGMRDISAPATEPAQRWAGWGTALKPSHEPICLARKPLIGTVAENVMAHGTGALNIDASRIQTDPNVDDPRLGGAGTWSSDKMAKNVYEGGYAGERVGSSPLGRWPANLVHDGSDEVVGLFPQTKSGTLTPDMNVKPSSGWAGGSQADRVKSSFAANEGSAARFFYCAKASKKDRDEGNGHPTVKPTSLMRWLVRLVTPPGGTVLDPFMGSGSTGKACVLEGFDFIGIEREPEYYEIAKARIDAAEPQQLALTA